MTSAVQSVIDRVEPDEIDSSDVALIAGRTGWFAKGVVYLIMAIIAVRIGLGSPASSSDAEASPKGAIGALSDQPFGRGLLAALAIGVLFYAGWRLVTAALPASDGDEDAVATLHRLAYVGSAGLYAVVGFAAASAVLSGNSSRSSSDRTIENLTKTAMEQPLGRWLVVAAGIALMVVGIAFAAKGIAQKFGNDLDYDIGSESDAHERWLTRLGVGGWVGRAMSVLLVGSFLIRAGLQSNADKAKGLDGTLRELAGSAVGTTLVLLTAVGLALYGAFCIASAQRREISGP